MMTRKNKVAMKESNDTIDQLRFRNFMNISWYNSIPVLKNGIGNTVFYSVTNQKPVHFSKMR